MYLSELKIWNFRKYGMEGADIASAKPGLAVKFRKGLNVLVGENDSGKTAIIDAIRYTLHTQSGEYIPIDEKDFYCDNNGRRADELKIECMFDGLSEKDQGLFLEWLTLNEAGELVLKVWLYVKMADNAIYPQFFAGSGDGTTMDGAARNMLRSVYLKPLRDALTDMTHGYKSRLAQILGAHKVFKTEKDDDGQRIRHELEEKYNSLKQEIEAYFEEGNGSEISSDINKRLSKHFLFDDRQAKIKLAGGELTEILRQLDLVLESNKSGLGTLNLLCIAAELLMMSQQQIGLKLVQIEELEAHLHPQFQMKVIDYIKEISESEGVQFLLSTHSITLASKLPLESLVVCKGDRVFPLGPGFTYLQKSDYSFLERFLDATKANLFFARGVIIVEGDAENLLLPAIAEAIGRPLNRCGVSIVNVGSTAYKRYANIFHRQDGQKMDIPVAIVTDMDIPSIEHCKTQPDKWRVWTRQHVLDLANALGCSIQGEKIPEYFRTKEALRRILEKQSVTSTDINAILESLTNDSRIEVDADILDSMRKYQKKHIEDLNKTLGDVHIYMPECWTLEFDLAMSPLAYKLYVATQLAKKEAKNQIEDFNTTYKETKEVCEKKWVEEIKPLNTEEAAYKIYRPLCENAISKAITAQMMAELICPRILLTSQDIKDKISEQITNDPYLRYLVDAINYATGKKG